MGWWGHAKRKEFTYKMEPRAGELCKFAYKMEPTAGELCKFTYKMEPRAGELCKFTYKMELWAGGVHTEIGRQRNRFRSDAKKSSSTISE